MLFELKDCKVIDLSLKESMEEEYEGHCDTCFGVSFFYLNQLEVLIVKNGKQSRHKIGESFSTWQSEAKLTNDFLIRTMLSDFFLSQTKNYALDDFFELLSLSMLTQLEKEVLEIEERSKGNISPEDDTHLCQLWDILEHIHYTTSYSIYNEKKFNKSHIESKFVNTEEFLLEDICFKLLDFMEELMNK